MQSWIDDSVNKTLGSLLFIATLGSATVAAFGLWLVPLYVALFEAHGIHPNLFTRTILLAGPYLGAFGLSSAILLGLTLATFPFVPAVRHTAFAVLLKGGERIERPRGIVS